LLVVVSSLATYLVIHLSIGPLSASDAGPFEDFPARPLPEIVSDLFSAWHGLWFAAPVGLLMLRHPHRRDIAFMACSLTIGTLVTSLLASDTTRMAQPLFPVVALGGAAFVAALWKHSPWLTTILVGGSVAASGLWQPLRFLHPAPISATGRDLAVLLLTATALTGAARIFGSAPALSGVRGDEG
jgi:hypothetical protein